MKLELAPQSKSTEICRLPVSLPLPGEAAEAGIDAAVEAAVEAAADTRAAIVMWEESFRSVPHRY